MAHTNWNCPQCHKQNISGELFSCPACGKKRNRWGYWDCRYCGAKMIRADHKECVSCGHAKDRDVKFYLTDDCPVEFVDEVSGENAVRIGKQNWICPFCSQQNDPDDNICKYCGSPRQQSTENYHDIPHPNTKKPYKKPNTAVFIILLIIGFFMIFGPVFFVLFSMIFYTGDESGNGGSHSHSSRDDDDDDDWDGWDDWDDGGYDDYGDGQFGLILLPVPEMPIMQNFYTVTIK